MPKEWQIGRRGVLKALGGATAAATLGGLSTGSVLGAHADDGTGVRVNQVGYPTNGRKVAVITDEFVDDIDAVSAFEVQDAASGSTVFTEADGTLTAAFDDQHSNSGQRVRHAIFTGLTTPGEYVVVAGGETSHPFRIGPPDNLYGDLLIDVGRLYSLKRANVEVTDPRTGLDIGPGHVQDAQATVATLQGDATFADYGITSVSKGDSIDATAGWYDAGDYGKYTITTAIAAAHLLLAYEVNPDIFGTGQFEIPQSIGDPNVGSMPDVLAEAKYGIEFLDNIQVDEGAVFHKVAGTEWPGDHVAPSEDTQERFAFGISSASTAVAGAAFAQAARIYQGVDDDFANRMQSNAESAYSWLQNNRSGSTVWVMADQQNTGSGAYARTPDSNPDDPGRYWLAAELLRLTGEQQYEDRVQTIGLPGSGLQPIDWNNTITLGHYAYYMAEGANKSAIFGGWSGGTVSWNGLHWTTGQLFTQPAAYPDGLYPYYWGALKSGVSRGTQILLTKELLDATNNYSGIDWTQDHPLGLEPLHHVLGRSATGYSYVTKYGEVSTENPHDRIVQSQQALPPGMLVGGPHNSADIWDSSADTTSEHISQNTPPAMSYYDDHGSFATNEWAINYTAPLFLLLAQSMDGVSSPPQLTDQTVYDAIDANDDLDISDDELLSAFAHHNEGSEVTGTGGRTVDEPDHDQFLHQWSN